ncbi:MAG TPA: PDZ domain-containing protein, partial [Candidatus Bathyarchaeia archaeon]
VGFAIPVNTVKWVANQIFEKGRVVRPWLGIVGTSLNKALARRYDLHGDSGVLVFEVDQRGPAYEAGLRVGDIIVQIGSHEIRQMKDVLSALSKLRINDEVEASLLRLGTRRKTSLRLMEAPVQMVPRRR